MSSHKSRYNEVPGNAMASQVLFQEQMIAIGRKVMEMGRLTIGDAEAGDYIKQIKLCPPGPSRADWLVVITAQLDETGVIAFSGGSTIQDAIATLVNRANNGSLKWRPDEYAK